MNPFETMAETQIAAPVRRKQEQAAARAQKKAARLATMTESEKREEEAATLFRQYRAWQRQRLADQMEGEFGEMIRPLVAFLRKMTLDDHAEMVRRIEGARSWLRTAPRETRLVVLRAVSDAVCRIRINAFLPPIDDALPGEPPTAYEVVRPMILGDML